MKKYLWSAKVFLQLWFYLKFHTIEDFEEMLFRAGCTVSFSQKCKFFYFPRGGKIIIEGDVIELIPANASR